jgi:hypothetical protein
MASQQLHSKQKEQARRLKAAEKRAKREARHAAKRKAEKLSSAVDK